MSCINAEVVAVTYNVLRSRGHNVSLQDAIDVLHKVETDPTIQEFEKQVAPITKWIHEQKELAWFVETKRVTELGAKISDEIKQSHPEKTHKECVKMMMERWAQMVKDFAREHGYYQHRLLPQPPLSDDDFKD